MSVILLIDGQPSDVDNFIESIVQRTIKAISPQIQEAVSAPAFTIDPARMYNLSNPDIVSYLGYEKHVRPQIAIAKRMRDVGISPISGVRRNGLMVSGQDVINYLAAVRKQRNSFSTKN